MTTNWTSGIRQVQEAALEFCAHYTNCAIGIFEPGEDGDEIKEFLPRTYFEPYCKKLRSTPEGDRLCHQDHLKRAEAAIASGKPALTLCHAGVFNQALPIKVGGQVKSVLLYGQMLVEGEPRSAEAEQLRDQVIARLQPNEDDELTLRMHYDRVKRLSKGDLQRINKQLSLLQKLFHQMTTAEQDRGRQTEFVIHELQTRLQPTLARAEEISGALHGSNPKEADLQSIRPQSKKLLQELLTMRDLIWKLGRFTPRDEYTLHSLWHIVNDAVSLYKEEALRKKVQFKVDVKGPSEIEMSKTNLQIAFNNLVHNAVKYSFRGSYHRTRYIEIRGEVHGFEYHLSIANYGVGVLPEEYLKIFTHGYQGELTRQEHRAGAGMGLAFAKEIIEEHQGSITVESTPMGGEAYLTQFTVVLPRRQKL